jgi:hypothetical protein
MANTSAIMHLAAVNNAATVATSRTTKQTEINEENRRHSNSELTELIPPHRHASPQLEQSQQQTHSSKPPSTVTPAVGRPTSIVRRNSVPDIIPVNESGSVLPAVLSSVTAIPVQSPRLQSGSSRGNPDNSTRRSLNRVLSAGSLRSSRDPPNGMRSTSRQSSVNRSRRNSARRRSSVSRERSSSAERHLSDEEGTLSISASELESRLQELHRAHAQELQTLRARLAATMRSVEEEREAAVAAALNKERDEHAKRVQSLERQSILQMRQQADHLSIGFEKRFGAFQATMNDHHLLAAQKLAKEQVREMAAQLTIQEIMLASQRNEIASLASQNALQTEQLREYAESDQSMKLVQRSAELTVARRELSEAQRTQQSTEQLLTLFQSRTGELEERLQLHGEESHTRVQELSQRLAVAAHIGQESFRALSAQYQSATHTWTGHRAEAVSLLKHKDEVITRQDESISRLLFENAQLLKQLQAVGVFTMGSQTMTENAMRVAEGQQKDQHKQHSSEGPAATGVSSPPLNESNSASSLTPLSSTDGVVHQFPVHVPFTDAHWASVSVPQLPDSVSTFFAQQLAAGTVSPLDGLSPAGSEQIYTPNYSPMVEFSPTDGNGERMMQYPDTVSIPSDTSTTHSSPLTAIRSLNIAAASSIPTRGASSRTHVHTVRAASPIQQNSNSNETEEKVEMLSQHHHVTSSHTQKRPQGSPLQSHQPVQYTSVGGSQGAYPARPSVPAGAPLATGYALSLDDSGIAASSTASGVGIAENLHLSRSSPPASGVGPYSSTSSVSASALAPENSVGMSQEWKRYNSYRAEVVAKHAAALKAARWGDRFEPADKNNRGNSHFEYERWNLMDSEQTRGEEKDRMRQQREVSDSGDVEYGQEHEYEPSTTAEEPEIRPAPLPHYASVPARSIPKSALKFVSPILSVPPPQPSPLQRHTNLLDGQYVPTPGVSGHAISVHGVQHASSIPTTEKQRNQSGLTPLAHDIIAKAVQSSLPIKYDSHTQSSGTKVADTAPVIVSPLMLTPLESSQPTLTSPTVGIHFPTLLTPLSNASMSGMSISAALDGKENGGSMSAKVKDLRGKRIRQTLEHRARQNAAAAATTQPQQMQQQHSLPTSTSLIGGSLVSPRPPSRPPAVHA